MNRPPPPGPPGMYLRFLKGGPSGDSTGARDALGEDLGRLPEDLPERVRRWVGAIAHVKFGGKEDELRVLCLQIAV